MNESIVKVLAILHLSVFISTNIVVRIKSSSITHWEPTILTVKETLEI